MTKKSSKLARYMKAPFRFLVKARDMYVRGMIEWSSNISYADIAMGCPVTAHLYSNNIPRSFSVNSSRSSPSNDDFKELVRVASLKIGRGHDRVEFGPAAVMKVPRSRSVGIRRIERIEEDEPCEFGNDIIVKSLLYSRSRSHAF